jgi:GDPmannose 4,6-dehydratase
LKALIIGVTGQDGSLLAESLLKKGFEVHGTFRRGSSDTFWRLLDLDIYKKIVLHTYHIGSQINISKILKDIEPEYIFVSAGESFTEMSFEEPKHYLEINTGGAIEILEAVKNFSPESRVFFSSSSEIFGQQDKSIDSLKEDSLTVPNNPYGISRLAMGHFVRVYRERYKLNLFTGILFPHESPYRGREFVTRKITHGIVRTNSQGAAPMILRGIDMSRDWGSAKDYVNWMINLLEKGHPGEYIFATGVNSSVRDFLELSFKVLQIEVTEELDMSTNELSFKDSKNGKILIKSNSSKALSNSLTYPPGSNAKLFNEIGIQRITPLQDIVTEMITKELSWL